MHAHSREVLPHILICDTPHGKHIAAWTASKPHFVLPPFFKFVCSLAFCLFACFGVLLACFLLGGRALIRSRVAKAGLSSRSFVPPARELFAVDRAGGGGGWSVHSPLGMDEACEVEECGQEGFFLGHILVGESLFQTGAGQALRPCFETNPQVSFSNLSAVL